MKAVTTKYLYGDATRSPLEVNYIRFLRDVLDYCVSVLAAAELVTKYQNMATELESSTKEDVEKIRAVGKKLSSALDACAGDNPPIVKRCIDSIRTAAFNELKRAEGEMSTALNSELERIKRQIEQERGNSLKRLQTLLLQQDLPGTEHWINLQLPPTGTYVAELAGNASSEVSWLIDLEIPSGHPLSQAVRVEQVMPGLAINMPQESGWVRKSVTLREQRVDNKYIAGLTQTPSGSMIKLRNSLDGDAGFDLTIAAQGKAVSLVHVGKGAPPEPFNPKPEDCKQLRILRDKLLSAAMDLKRSRKALREARLDGTAFQDHKNTKILVQRIIKQVAPVVREIDKHTLSPDELVLKRVMSDDRREEIFISKESLREKIAPLPPKLRSMFEPLGLGEIARGQSKISDEAATVEEVNELEAMSKLNLERLSEPPTFAANTPKVIVSGQSAPPKIPEIPDDEPKKALPTGSNPPPAEGKAPEAQSSVGGVDISFDELDDDED